MPGNNGTGTIIEQPKQNKGLSNQVVSAGKIYTDFELKYPLEPTSFDEALSLASTKLTAFGNQQKYQCIQMLIGRDSQLQACIQSRINTILQMPWGIIYNSDDTQSKEAGEFIENVFYKQIGEGRLNQYIEELLQAILYGFSVSEIVYEFKDNRIVPVRLNNWNQNNFSFKAGGELVWITNKDVMSVEGIQLEPTKFIVHKHNPSQDNPFGNGIITASVFWASYRKQYLLNYASVLSERYANPFAWATVPVTFSQEAQTQIAQALSALYNNGVAVFQEGVVPNIIEAGSTSKNIIQEFINTQDEQIALAILGQRFTTTGGDTGSYARDKVAKDVSYDIIRADCVELANTLNNAIKFWVSINFPNIIDYPIFKYKLDVEEDLEKQANILRTITQDIGMEVPKAYAYEHLGLPMPIEGDEVVGRVQVEQANPFGGLMASGNSDRVHYSQKKNILEFAEKQSVRDAESIIELTEKSIGKIAKAFQMPFDAIVKAASKIKTPADLNNFTLPGKDLQEYNKQIFDAMFFYYGSGYWLARRNMGKLEMGAKQGDLFIYSDRKDFASVNYETEPMPYLEAIEYFRNKIPALIGDLDKLEESLRVNAFYMSRATSYVALERVKALIENAMLEGTWTDKFLQDNRMELENLGFDTKNPYYLNNVFRTNLATSYAAGQWQQQTDPAVQRLVPYFRYVAVNDSSTRPSHAAMNGVTRPQDDPIWDSWYSPNGYQCRCTVVAVSKSVLDALGYKVTRASSIPKVQPDNGFTTNPAKTYVDSRPQITGAETMPENWGRS